MGIVGRPRMKNRLPNRPYNISEDTHDCLDKLKKKGETQDGFIKRLLLENEEVALLRSDLKDMTYLRDDALKNGREIRESKAALEIKLKESRQVEGLIRAMPWTQCMMLPWVF